VRLALVLALAPVQAGRAGVLLLRDRQAEALRAAARRAGAPAEGFPRDAAGAPLPLDEGGAGRWRWSAANTRGAALAAVAEGPVGVDIESLARPRVAPARAFADAGELALAPLWDDGLTLALWTAKEALLKESGAGISELRACRLVEAPVGREPAELVLSYRGRARRVALLRAEGFLLALASGAEGAPPALSVLPRAVAAEAAP